jgi:hypothetical protein
VPDLQSEPYQGTVGDDDDGEDDGEGAVARGVQGQDRRTEDDELHPQPYERHRHRGARRREQAPEDRRKERCTEPERCLRDQPVADRHPPVTERGQGAQLEQEGERKVGPVEDLAYQGDFRGSSGTLGKLKGFG